MTIDRLRMLAGECEDIMAAMHGLTEKYDLTDAPKVLDQAVDYFSALRRWARVRLMRAEAVALEAVKRRGGEGCRLRLSRSGAAGAAN